MQNIMTIERQKSETGCVVRRSRYDAR